MQYNEQRKILENKLRSVDATRTISHWSDDFFLEIFAFSALTGWRDVCMCVTLTAVLADCCAALRCFDAEI